MSSCRKTRLTNSPYYIVPDGEVGQQAFAVIREAIRKEGMVAIGKVVFTSREHVIALEARDKGLLGITLRYPYEVRKPEEYLIPKDDREPGILYPRLIEAKGHCPPEDVGGPWRYGEFIEAIANPSHERHRELKEWFADD